MAGRSLSIRRQYWYTAFDLDGRCVDVPRSIQPAGTPPERPKPSVRHGVINGVRCVGVILEARTRSRAFMRSRPLAADFADFLLALEERAFLSMACAVTAPRQPCAAIVFKKPVRQYSPTGPRRFGVVYEETHCTRRAISNGLCKQHAETERRHPIPRLRAPQEKR